MLSGRAHTIDTEGADAVWLRDLLQIETVYGRLVYLAQLRNPDNGRYEHYGSAPGTAHNVAVSRQLKKAHEGIFRDWVSYSLERKKADIELYITRIAPTEQRELVDAWLRMTPYRNLVPASVQGPERQRHISDFEVILGLLRNVYGVSDPNQNA